MRCIRKSHTCDIDIRHAVVHLHLIINLNLRAFLYLANEHHQTAVRIQQGNCIVCMCFVRVCKIQLVRFDWRLHIYDIAICNCNLTFILQLKKKRANHEHEQEQDAAYSTLPCRPYSNPITSALRWLCQSMMYCSLEYCRLCQC